MSVFFNLGFKTQIKAYIRVRKLNASNQYTFDATSDIATFGVKNYVRLKIRRAPFSSFFVGWMQSITQKYKCRVIPIQCDLMIDIRY